MDQPKVPARWQMGAESVDIGPPSQAVFLRIEEDAFGHLYASFATSDGDVFSLDKASLGLRIAWLSQQGQSTDEEELASARLS